MLTYSNYSLLLKVRLVQPAAACCLSLSYLSVYALFFFLPVQIMLPRSAELLACIMIDVRTDGSSRHAVIGLRNTAPETDMLCERNSPMPVANIIQFVICVFMHLEGTCTSGGCKCGPISVKQNLKIEANVSECTECYRVNAC